MKGFPTRSPSDLEHRSKEQQWLVDGLWGREAVGIIGGEPKCGKSFLALDLAVAVAAGVPCLRRFEADQPGPVLMFAAEDAGHIVRTRLQGIAQAAGADFETLDIAVIDVPTLRLDHRNDRQRLQETMERIEPRLLVLDPLVRLHGVDENAVADIAPILGFLRDLQRRFGTSVLLVHHARKSGATRPGQALRGSSELHAWGDSNLYLRRRDKQIVMTVEHRAAPGLNDIEVELADHGQGPALRLRRAGPAEAAPEPETPEQRIVQALTLWDRFEFVFTPKHGSWLNIAEIELNVMIRQCLNRRIASFDVLRAEVAAWQAARDRVQAKVDWQFTTDDARVRLKRLYPTFDE